jgi:copper homeostasis protein
MHMAKMGREILLEICCGGIDDAIQAELGGADRVELCSALFLGGLTPSFGTIQQVKERLKIPVMVMVRPRAGGFCYSEAEMSSMERDAEAAVEQGADGIVFAILQANGKVDVARSKRLLRRIGDRQSVFHRAFDVTPDPFRALEQLIDLGVRRVLTSGQKDSAPEGADMIAVLVKRAKGRIEVLPGGGIQPYHVKSFLAQTGCDQVHMTAWQTLTDSSIYAHPEVTFGGALYPREDRYQVTDAKLVKKVKHSMKSGDK